MAIWNRIKLIMEKADTKHIVILSMGVLGGQIVNILVQPIATRLYSPEAFGNLSLMISLGTMFAPIATLQYHIAIVHSKKEEEFALYKLNFLLVAITAFFFFFCLFGYLQFGTPKYDTVGSLIYISILWYIMNGLVSMYQMYVYMYLHRTCIHLPVIMAIMWIMQVVHSHRVITSVHIQQRVHSCAEFILHSNCHPIYKY